MTIFISTLIKELYDDIKTDSPLFIEVTNEFEQLLNSRDTKRQEKMISLLLGSILHSINSKTQKHPFLNKYYQEAKKLPRSETILDLIYSYGNFALKALNPSDKPESGKLRDDFTSIFYQESELITGYFFPKISSVNNKLMKIDFLMDYCFTHSQLLETPWVIDGSFDNTEETQVIADTEMVPLDTPRTPETEDLELVDLDTPEATQTPEPEPEPTENNSKAWCSALCMNVISGFMIVLGITTFVLALTLLTGGSAGVLCLVGGALVTGGLTLCLEECGNPYGFFAKDNSSSKDSSFATEIFTELLASDLPGLN